MLSIVLVGVLGFILIECTKNDSIKIGQKSGHNVRDDLTSLKVKEGSLTNSKATLILENLTEGIILFSASYLIEYERDGIWYEIIPIKKLYFPSHSFSLKAKESIEMLTDWEYHYSKLASSKYRILKNIWRESDLPINESNEIYSAVEFIIK